jgi:hypothetical protein
MSELQAHVGTHVRPRRELCRLERAQPRAGERLYERQAGGSYRVVGRFKG